MALLKHLAINIICTLLLVGFLIVGILAHNAKYIAIMSILTFVELALLYMRFDSWQRIRNKDAKP